jgi:hypothetical protein
MAGQKREARLRADGPAIHAFPANGGQDVDARDKPGHDEEYFRYAAQPSAYISRSTTLASVAGRLMISSYMSIVTAQ